MRATARRNADVRIGAMPMRCDAPAASRHMGPMIPTAWLNRPGNEISGSCPILLQLVLATTQSVGLRTSAGGRPARVPMQKLIAREGL